MTEGSLYEFKIAATNLAGIGQPSDPSEHFKCEAWTAPEPGETVCRVMRECEADICDVCRGSPCQSGRGITRMVGMRSPRQGAESLE